MISFKPPQGSARTTWSPQVLKSFHYFCTVALLHYSLPPTGNGRYHRSQLSNPHLQHCTKTKTCVPQIMARGKGAQSVLEREQRKWWGLASNPLSDWTVGGGWDIGRHKHIWTGQIFSWTENSATTKYWATVPRIKIGELVSQLVKNRPFRKPQMAHKQEIDGCFTLPP